MKNLSAIKLPNNPAEQMKVLNQLLQQARADKKAQSETAKEPAVKATFRLSKALKDRFVTACASQSQSEVIASLIEKFCRQSEKALPKVAEESSSSHQVPPESNEPLIDFSDL